MSNQQPEAWPTEHAATEALTAAATAYWDQIKDSMPGKYITMPFSELPPVKQNEIRQSLLPLIWAALGAVPDPRYSAWQEGFNEAYDIHPGGPFPRVNPYPALDNPIYQA